MDGTRISSLTHAAQAPSERYDDIAALLAHAQLDGFVYQSFRKESARTETAAGVSSPTLSSVQSDIATAPISAALPCSAASAAASQPAVPDTGGVLQKQGADESRAAFGALFDRLIAGSAQPSAERPRLDLHLPSRPLAAREAGVHEDLISLPKQRAFARLRDAAPRRMALSA